MKLRLVNLLLLAWLWWVALSLWPLLPERVPRHFNARGVVDAWGGKSLETWLLLPVIGALMLLLLELVGWLVRRKPEYVNLPNKRDYLALPAAERAPIAQELAGFVQATGSVLLLLLGIIQQAMYRAAVGLPTQHLMLVVLVLALVLLPVLTVVMVVRANTRVREAQRRVGPRAPHAG